MLFHFIILVANSMASTSKSEPSLSAALDRVLEDHVEAMRATSSLFLRTTAYMAEVVDSWNPEDPATSLGMLIEYKEAISSLGQEVIDYSKATIKDLDYNMDRISNTANSMSTVIQRVLPMLRNLSNLLPPATDEGASLANLVTQWEFIEEEVAFMVLMYRTNREHLVRACQTKAITSLMERLPAFKSPPTSTRAPRRTTSTTTTEATTTDVVASKKSKRRKGRAAKTTTTTTTDGVTSTGTSTTTEDFTSATTPTTTEATTSTTTTAAASTSTTLVQGVDEGIWNVVGRSDKRRKDQRGRVVTSVPSISTRAPSTRAAATRTVAPPVTLGARTTQTLSGEISRTTTVDVGKKRNDLLKHTLSADALPFEPQYVAMRPVVENHITQLCYMVYGASAVFDDIERLCQEIQMISPTSDIAQSATTAKLNIANLKAWLENLRTVSHQLVEQSNRLPSLSVPLHEGPRTSTNSI